MPALAYRQVQSGSGGGEQRGKARNWCKSFELSKSLGQQIDSFLCAEAFQLAQL